MAPGHQITWQEYLKLPPEKHSRPVTDAEFNALTQDQLEKYGFGQPSGVPLSFGGNILTAPPGTEVHWDTDNLTPVTRLPEGVKFDHQNAPLGQPQMDLSNPDPAQVLPPALQTVGAKMNAVPQTLPADFQGFDKPPDTLPANFSQWDAAPARGVADIPKPPNPLKGVAGYDLVGPVPESLVMTPRGMLEGISHITPPGIASSILQKVAPGSKAAQITAPIPHAPVEQLPDEMAIALASEVGGGAGEPGAPGARPKVAPAIDAAAEEGPSALGRLARHLPYIGKPLRLYDLGKEFLRGVQEGQAPEVQTPSTPNWNPQQMPPLSPREDPILARLARKEERPNGPIRGQNPNRIPPGTIEPQGPNPYAPQPVPAVSAPEGAQAASAPAPNEAAAPKPDTSPKAVQSQLNEALGGQPAPKPVPGVSIRNQPAAQAAAAGKLPEGFTPVKSSVLRGYKYSPDSQEFETVTNNGQHYVYGEVTPDQVAAFEGADSKGRAWNVIRQNITPLAKVVNGERVPLKRAGMRSVTFNQETGEPEFTQKGMESGTQEGDLTDILQKSLEQAQAGKTIQHPQFGEIPRFVYRARDVGEEGIPLQENSHAQATSDYGQAQMYAEPGQRSPNQGQVVRIDLSKLKPSDYTVKTHPDGPTWIKFTRPIGENELSYFAGPRQATGQNH